MNGCCQSGITQNSDIKLKKIKYPILIEFDKKTIFINSLLKDLEKLRLLKKIAKVKISHDNSRY